MKSHIGGFCSLIVSLITFMFAALKIQHLLLKKNPTINTYEIQDAFDGVNDKLQLSESDFMLAVGFDSWIEQGGRNDPRYIQWVA